MNHPKMVFLVLENFQPALCLISYTACVCNEPRQTCQAELLCTGVSFRVFPARHVRAVADPLTKIHSQNLQSMCLPGKYFKPKQKRLQHNVKDMKALPSMNKNCLSSFEMLSAPAPVNDSSAKVATIHQRLTLTRLDGDSAEENIPGCKQKDPAKVTEVWTEKTGSSSMYATIAIRNRIVVLDDFQ